MGSYSMSGDGLHTALQSFGAEGSGLHSALLAVSMSGDGLHRAANDALARYELYIGADASPDFDAAPEETFTSLPHTTSFAFLANTTYHLVTRLRNKYGLLSQNIEATLLELDPGSEEIATRPSDAFEVTLGNTELTAFYAYQPDGDDAADTWRLWLTSDGSTPDPDVDSPTLNQTMVKNDGIAKFTYSIAAFPDATTIKTVVRTVNGSLESLNTTVLTIVTDRTAPSAVAGHLNISPSKEQQQ